MCTCWKTHFWGPKMLQKKLAQEIVHLSPPQEGFQITILIWGWNIEILGEGGGNRNEMDVVFELDDLQAQKCYFQQV